MIVLQFYFALMQYQYDISQYNTLNIKLSKWQLNKLKAGIKNFTEVTLNLSSKVTGDFNDRINFLLRLSSTVTQALRLCKAFANNLSANIKLSKTELSKIVKFDDSINKQCNKRYYKSN